MNDSPPDSLVWEGREYCYIGNEIQEDFRRYWYGAFSHEPLSGIAVHIFTFIKPLEIIEPIVLKLEKPPKPTRKPVLNRLRKGIRKHIKDYKP